MSKKDPRLTKNRLEGFNKPKKTPSHPTKSHVVLAKKGDKIKLIRFGQQGVTGAFRLLPVARLYFARPFAVSPPFLDFSPLPTDKLTPFLAIIYLPLLVPFYVLE